MQEQFLLEVFHVSKQTTYVRSRAEDVTIAFALWVHVYSLRLIKTTILTAKLFKWRKK